MDLSDSMKEDKVMVARLGDLLGSLSWALATVCCTYEINFRARRKLIIIIIPTSPHGYCYVCFNFWKGCVLIIFSRRNVDDY